MSRCPCDETKINFISRVKICNTIIDELFILKNCHSSVNIVINMRTLTFKIGSGCTWLWGFGGHFWGWFWGLLGVASFRDIVVVRGVVTDFQAFQPHNCQRKCPKRRWGVWRCRWVHFHIHDHIILHQKTYSKLHSALFWCCRCIIDHKNGREILRRSVSKGVSQAEVLAGT